MNISWPSLIVGALLGAPVGFATTYAYDYFFPVEVSVEVQPIGVQGLNMPVSNFSGYGLAGGVQRDGFIEIWYAEGTETSGYRCGYSVSHDDLFEFVRMEDGCKRLNFAFNVPSKIPEKYVEVDVYPVFQIWVESPTGNRWAGSASLYFYLLP